MREYNKLKNTTIAQFRKDFFINAQENEELIAEFDEFVNLTKNLALFSSFLNSYSRVMLQKIYEEQKIGKKIGNLALLKARFKQAEKDLEKYIEDLRLKQKKEQFTEIGFVEWVATVSKYYGYEIRQETSIFDFLVMAKKMNKDIEQQQRDFRKIKRR